MTECPFVVYGMCGSIVTCPSGSVVGAFAARRLAAVNAVKVKLIPLPVRFCEPFGCGAVEGAEEAAVEGATVDLDDRARRRELDRGPLAVRRVDAAPGLAGELVNREADPVRRRVEAGRELLRAVAVVDRLAVV